MLRSTLPVGAVVARWFSLCALGTLGVSGSSFAAGGVPAQAVQIFVYNYDGLSGPYAPLAGVVADAQGRLYGTTSGGGAPGVAAPLGAVYRLSPPAPGGTQWTEEVLHTFTGSAGGSRPSTSVVIGPDGSVYGTTPADGVNDYGKVFKLTNSPGWPETILHSFSTSEAYNPATGLAFGQDGMLYGTTRNYRYQRASGGTEFRLSPLGDTVAYSIINEFESAGAGRYPVGLTPFLPGRGNGFFGATNDAPNLNSGLDTVYALQVHASGQTRQTLLHSFTQPTPPGLSAPTAPPIEGAYALSGGLYGCAQSGGASGEYNYGGIYQITQGADGGFTYSDIHDFLMGANDGIATDHCSLLQDTYSGRIVGITGNGYHSENGFTYHSNAFFGLTPPASAGGTWAEQVYVYVPYTIGTEPEYPMAQIGHKYYIVFNMSDPLGGFAPVGTVVEVTVTN